MISCNRPLIPPRAFWAVANFASCAASWILEQQRSQDFGRHTELCWKGFELSQSFLLGFFFGRDGFLNEKVSDEYPRLWAWRQSYAFFAIGVY